MRRFALLILLALFVAVPVDAQEAVDITIYRDADSLTIVTPGGALYGLALQVTLPDNRTLTQSLVAYAAFRGAQPTTPACFRLERAGSDSPTPQDCQNAQIFIQSLTDGDVFWHDSTLNQDFTVMIVRDGQIYGVCAAGIPRCTATFIPAPEEIALCDGAADHDNHEVLVIVAKFDKLSDSPLNPDREWEDAIQEAIDQLEGQVNARVLRVPQIVTSQEEALNLSNCYNATLVVWGKLAAARVESNYTAVARWSKLEMQPGQTNFEADTTLAQSINVLDQITIFVSLEGGDTEYVLYFVLAQLVYFGENREEALSFLEQASALAPNGRENEMGLAAIYTYIGYIKGAIQGDMDAALFAYTSALEITPGKPTVLSDRGNVYSSMGNFEAAIKDYTRAIQIAPQLAEPYNNRGLVYASQGDFIKAINDYNRAIQIAPELAAVYNNRGLVYQTQKKYELAITDYTHAIELMPTEAKIYYNRGLVYQTQKKYELAITDYTHAIELKPDYNNAFLNRGSTYALQGKYELAIIDYTQAIFIKPDDAIAYNNRGSAYAAQGQYIYAILDYEQSISINPTFIEPYFNRGLTYYRRGEYQRTIMDLTQVVILNSDYISAYWGLGDSYYALQYYDAALAAYRRYLELAGDSADPSIIARVRELEAATPTPSA